MRSIPLEGVVVVVGTISPWSVVVYVSFDGVSLFRETVEIVLVPSICGVHSAGHTLILNNYLENQAVCRGLVLCFYGSNPV